MTSSGEQADRTLLERDAELGLIEGLVSRASASSGGAIFVEGQAGVGKTELLRAASEIADYALEWALANAR